LQVALAKAEVLNAGLDAWRTGDQEREPTGTVRWLFGWYRLDKRFKSKAYKTRKDYTRYMDDVVAIPMRQGVFGDKLAAKVDGAVADKLMEKFSGRGDRTARYAMQVCRLVWTQAVRHRSVTGVTENPFAKMGIGAKAKHPNRPTTRAEYDLYRKTAHSLGHPEMAAAAALSFELCQRVSCVFGYADPDGRQRGILWSDYKVGKEIRLVQAKTQMPVEIPLTAAIADAATVSLYPELELELANLSRTADKMIVDPATGQPFSERRVSTLHRRICRAAGLPDAMKFTGFRHGGITELGNAGEADVRAISGHKQLSTTAIYNKANREQARRIAVIRRAHIESLGETADE
jgi:hypothetical protein